MASPPKLLIFRRYIVTLRIADDHYVLRVHSLSGSEMYGSIYVRLDTGAMVPLTALVAAIAVTYNRGQVPHEARDQSTAIDKATLLLWVSDSSG